MAKILTVFFSLKGENLAPGDKTVYLEKGNTAVAAEAVSEGASRKCERYARILIFWPSATSWGIRWRIRRKKSANGQGMN